MVLYKQYKSPSLDLPYSSYPLFDLDDMEDDEYLAEFRVKKRYIWKWRNDRRSEGILSNRVK